MYTIEYVEWKTKNQGLAHVNNLHTWASVIHQKSYQNSLAAPDPNKLLMKDDPWEKIDKGSIGGKDGGNNCAVEQLEWGDVEIVCQDWHQTE